MGAILTRSLLSELFSVGTFEKYYESLIDSNENLVARISVIAGYMREMPGVFGKIRHSLYRWLYSFL